MWGEHGWRPLNPPQLITPFEPLVPIINYTFLDAINRNVYTSQSATL